MSNEKANSPGNADFQLPVIPSEDWEMNVFLKELADGLTDADLKTMKHFLSGSSGTGKGVLENIKDPLDFFQHLRHRCILTSDNVVVLQAMLWHLGRKDLHNKFVKFAQRRGNIIHFYAPSDKPENGYEYLKFHIRGKEKMNRNKLEELRSLVSRILCVPQEFAIVVGIEATNSILVTFMVPEGLTNILFDLDDKNKEYLGSKGVDVIICCGRTINCSETHTIEKEERIQRDEEVAMLLKEKANLKKELDSVQIQALESDKSLRLCQKQLEETKRKAENRTFEVTSRLIEQYVGFACNPNELTLKNIALKNATKYARYMLKKVESLGYDADIIQCLLEANTIIASSQFRTIHQWIEQQQQVRIMRLQQDVTTLSYERDKLAYFLKAGISNPVLTKNEEFFLAAMGLNIPIPFGGPNISIKTEQFGEVEFETMRSIMRDLFKMMESYIDQTEKDLLVKKFLPSSREKKLFKDSNAMLLEHLWNVEISSKDPSKVNFHEWMVNILVTIKRMDLLNNWIHESNYICQSRIQSGRKTASSQASASAEGKDHGSSGKSSKHQTHQPQTKAKSSANDDKDIQLQLQRLEEMVERNIKLTERIALGPIDHSNPYGNVYSFGNAKLGAGTQYDWSKLGQSKIFSKK